MKYYPTTDKKYAYLNYGLYYNEEQKKYTGSVSAFYVAKDLFEDNNKPVALTADENAKLNLVESTGFLSTLKATDFLFDLKLF